MKYKIILMSISLIVIFYNTASAQLSIGGGIKLDVNEGQDFFGVNLRGYYNLTENIRFAPNFNLNLPAKDSYTIFSTEYEDKLSIFTFNLDGHYILNLEDQIFSLYGIGGIGYHAASIKRTRIEGNETTSSKISDSDFSFALGSGVEVPLMENINFFFEIKKLVGDYDPWNAATGIMISIY